MQHIIEGPRQPRYDADQLSRRLPADRRHRLRPGHKLRLVKYLAYGWSRPPHRPALHDQVVAALAGAKLTGWDRLLAEQQAYLDEYWAGADVELDGDAEVQQAVRCSSTCCSRRPGPAAADPGQGLTGTGYDGYTFWDTETFVLPVLTYTTPRRSPARCAGGS